MPRRKSINIVPTQQRIKSIKIERLKCVKDLEMSLEGNNVTAILGRNGSGKSTVLQAIYCLYQPKKEQFEVYRKRHKIRDSGFEVQSFLQTCGRPVMDREPIVGRSILARRDTRDKHNKVL